MHKVFIGKPEKESPLWRPGRRWEDNIEMDLKEMWWEGVVWIQLVQDMDQWSGLTNAE
jgi:hypothetical protein